MWFRISFSVILPSTKKKENKRNTNQVRHVCILTYHSWVAEVACSTVSLICTMVHCVLGLFRLPRPPQVKQKAHHQLLFREPTSLRAFVEMKAAFSQVSGYFIKKEMKSFQDGKMAQHVEASTKSDDLSWIPETHRWKERTKLQMLNVVL